MGKFSKIKKYNLDSLSIDEKIKFLDKEMEKTGLNEVAANSTAGVYVSTPTTPNQNFSDFEAINHGGYSLGLSGADGNGAGGGIIGTLESPHTFAGLTGVALSPPHPITGLRTNATTITDGTGSSHPLVPGTNSGGSYLRGGALWFFDSNYNFAGQQGRWLNFEWSTQHNTWAFWDTNFLGFYFLNPNLDQYELGGVNIGTQIKNKISSINFTGNGVIGTAETIVLTQNKLDDSSFLPIYIDGLSTQGFNYLKGKAGVEVSAAPYYSIEDKKNVINYYKKKRANPNYQPKPYERESLMRQMRAQGDGTQIASTDPSAAFPSAPPDAFEPEIGTVELTPADIPAEFKTDDKDKPSAKGVTLTKWMSRTDFMKLYPDSTMSEYLAALPYGATNFMKPDPNFPNARIVDTEAYERYFMTGDTSGVSGESRHSEATPEPKQKMFGEKSYEEVMADLDKTIEKYSTMEKQAYTEMRQIALELGMDFVSLIGGLFTGGTTAAPVLGKLGMKLLKKYGKTVAGKMIRKLIKKFRNKKNSKQLDKIIDDIDNAEAQELDPRKPFEPDAGDMYPRLTRKGEQIYDTATERLINQRRLGGKDGDLAGRFLDDLVDAMPKGDAALNNVMNKIKKSPIGYLFNSYKPNGKLLSEAAKLGHFDPESLTVDIEKLRKGILPEFPKKAPPKMIDGYSEKSKLAPKKAEKEPFIKITKKDLAKNHQLKDSEIKEFMDTFKMINDFIKKHPEELIYAQQRYPVDDKRLAALNWKMDQMLEAGQEYLDTQFPENQRLVDRIKKATKKTMELTNPEAYKDLKKPDMELMSLDDHMKQKRVVSRHFKKKRQSKSMFRVEMEKVKEKNRKVAEQKVAEWQEKRRIELLNSNEFDELKYDWRKELGEG